MCAGGFRFGESLLLWMLNTFCKSKAYKSRWVEKAHSPIPFSCFHLDYDPKINVLTEQKYTHKKASELCVCAVFFDGSAHRPASSVRGHVAVDLEARKVVNWKHGVDAVLSLTTCVEVAAVAGARALVEVKGRTC